MTWTRNVSWRSTEQNEVGRIAQVAVHQQRTHAPVQPALKPSPQSRKGNKGQGNDSDSRNSPIYDGVGVAAKAAKRSG
jgi:hypothetical protein